MSNKNSPTKWGYFWALKYLGSEPKPYELYKIFMINTME
jgi:hypothetical protein